MNSHKAEKGLRSIWFVSFGPWCSECRVCQRRHSSGNIHRAACLYRDSVCVFSPSLKALPCSPIDDIKLSMASLCLESVSAGMWSVWLALSCVSDWEVKNWEIKQDVGLIVQKLADQKRKQKILEWSIYTVKGTKMTTLVAMTCFEWAEWVHASGEAGGVAVAWLLLQSWLTCCQSTQCRSRTMCGAVAASRWMQVCWSLHQKRGTGPGVDLLTSSLAVRVGTPASAFMSRGVAMLLTTVAPKSPYGSHSNMWAGFRFAQMFKHHFTFRLTDGCSVICTALSWRVCPATHFLSKISEYSNQRLI